MSEQKLIVLDFVRHETYTLYGDDAKAFAKQAADQWCSTHTHAVRGLVSRKACPYCVAEAAQDTA